MPSGGKDTVRAAQGAPGSRSERPQAHKIEPPAVKMEDPAAEGPSSSGGRPPPAGPLVRAKEGSSPEDVKNTGGPKEDAKQLVLNMDEGGAMRLDDPAKVGKRALRGPAIGGDFGKSCRGKRRICAYLKDFRSRAYMYRAIWQGRFKKTRHGIEKKDLCVSASGLIVSKKRSVHSRKLGTLNGWIEHWRMWCRATSQARGALGVTGFLKVKKGGTDEERSLFKKVAANYTSLKATRRAAAEPSVDEVAGAAAALTSAGA